MMGDGLSVSFHDEVAGGEGGDKHHEGAAGEMEVGEEGIDGAELVGRVDEDVGLAMAGGDFAVAGEVFEDAGHGGADGGDFGSGLDFGGGFGGEEVLLGVHVVFARVVHFDRSEGAHADVEGEEGVIEFCEEIGGEMKAGGGGGDRSFLLGVNGLVAVAVGFFHFAVEVVWEGELADFVEVGCLIPDDESFALFVDLDDLAGVWADLDGAADFHAFSGADEAPPMGGIDGIGAEEFDGVIVGKDTSGDDFGVVEDEEVIGREEFWEIGEVVVGDRAGGAVDEHHARGGPIGEGARGDEFGREFVEKITGSHREGR